MGDWGWLHVCEAAVPEKAADIVGKWHRWAAMRMGAGSSGGGGEARDGCWLRPARPSDGLSLAWRGFPFPWLHSREGRSPAEWNVLGTLLLQ